MSRKVYTYTDLSKINTSKNFIELMKYPQIVVSTDLRKCLNGRPEFDKVQGLVNNANFKVTDFHSFSCAIDEDWNTDQSKFMEMILLSEFMRGKLNVSGKDAKDTHWLNGCMRNLDAMLSAIILLEQSNVMPTDIEPKNNRNLALLVEAWRHLEKADSSIKVFRNKMKSLCNKNAWSSVLKKVFGLDSVSGIDTLVFHGFYYITPHQERIMNLLEMAGFQLIFLIPYDQRYPYVYEIWEQTYSEARGFESKSNWKIEKSNESDPYGEIFEGKVGTIQNKLVLREYASIMEFVDDVKHIKELGFSIYSSDFKAANLLLKEYFPEDYGERKILSYPIGQFINVLNRMWDNSENTIVIEEEQLIECFSSGWLAVDGIAGKEYMQDLMYILPFFKGCRKIEAWEKKIKLLNEIRKNAIEPFELELDSDVTISRWQEAIGSPLKNFSVFSVEPENVDIILKLIKQLLNMARELFGNNSIVNVQEHIRTLDYILKKHEHSNELYIEERELIGEIFEKLGADNRFNAECHPADIAKALELFVCGKYEEGEIQTNRVGLVYPLYFVDAACVKNRSKVHLCMSDVERLPGKNKDYIWPLTSKIVKEIYCKTKNRYLLNLMQIMESNIICNRYFTYVALKNKEVTLSWISTMGEKMLAPSPYIKLLLETTDVKLTPSVRNAVTSKRVSEAPVYMSRIMPYEKKNAPAGIIKEARMSYALCPMKYVLGYVLEKFPTYQSDFQMNYALNALISAIYNLMKNEGMNVNQAYEAVVELFPNMRRAEKRQVFDYISYDRKENDLDYGNRTECGGRYYTDERLKIHYPNIDVRRETIARYGKLNTPDGRRDLDLYETATVQGACTFCQHVNYCRNAMYAVDQENYYD